MDRGVALLLPGMDYGPDRPLLRSAGEVFRRHGWVTGEFGWSARPPQRDGQDFAAWFARLRDFVRAQVEPALTDEVGALAAKSMGCFAAALPDVPAAVWLTPPLRDSSLTADLRRARAPFLLVGSAADPSWEPVEAAHVHQVPDADHNLEVAGDPARSAVVLREVTAAMDAFVRGLPRRSSR